MDRQALIFLPTLNCPYVLLQISGNFLPGIEPLSTAYARVSPRVLHGGGGAAALGEHRRETLGAHQLTGRLELRR
jgi:hypothetical protein